MEKDLYSFEKLKDFLNVNGMQVKEPYMGPLEKVCGYRSTIKILFCPFIKLNNG